MAAPTPTARATPAGIKLKDGFRSLVTFALDTNIELWEKQVTPPGLDGGDSVEQTTMHNQTYRTFAPRSLRTLTEMKFTAAYDPQIYVSVLAAINREDTITVAFKDGSTVCFFGYLKNFEPGELVEGTQPEATCTIVPTNIDSSGVEQAAVLTSVAGT